ncbi:putative plasmid partition protein A (plasmid) [Aliivibrio salmonicida LFI1238]|jgi:cellulose biosynthesis protein BcsQ|uniref:Plasmid partition protein A n=1 Tax=Aliivibrio salmonicida (strain LFI1238) TaxID=316275 RepID=B6ET11_ALISL|nr:ParA family protein [Aliivibrio salmonicida]CAQ81899.1 putative plasmid partition protein A [Aliivibrio salmonicida LFI1238]
MNQQDTLTTIRSLANVSKRISIAETELKLTGDAPNQLYYRTYNLNEACEACRNVDHRKLKEVLVELGYNPKFCFPIDSLLLEKIRNKLLPERSKKRSTKAVVYAFSNFKGGTCKTTSCVTLATGLCTEIFDRELRVGVIDLDPQGSSTTFLRPNITDDDYSIGEILKQEYELEEGETLARFVNECFLDTQIPNLRILPARPMDRSYEAQVLREQFNAEQTKKHYAPHLELKKIIDAVSEQFDVIMIDCSPNFGTSVIAAHYVATSLIIPVRPSELDKDSSVKYFEFLEDIYSTVLCGFDHNGYDHINVLPTAVNENSSTEITIASTLRIGANNNCFQGNFLHSEAVSNLSARHQTIFGESKSQYNATKKTLQRAQLSTYSLIVALYEQIQSTEFKREA